MFDRKSVETLVVGAGPCGMLAALILADGGHDVAIVDSATRSCTTSNCAILHPLTLTAMKRLGIGDRLINSGYKVDTFRFFDGYSERSCFKMGELPIRFPYSLSISQADLEMFLEEELEKLGVRILWNHRVSEIKNGSYDKEVTVDRYDDRGTGYAVSRNERVIVKSLRFQAKRLIAADGYNSILRRMLDVKQEPLGESQYFVTFEFETDRDPEHTTLVSIEDGLASAQQAIGAGEARLQFQFTGLTLPSRNRDKDRSFVHSRRDIPDYLDEKHFTELMKDRIPWKTGYRGSLTYRAATPFEKRYLPMPYKDNVFFLGDAARSFAPLSSLSLNLGLQEAEELAHATLMNIDNPKHCDAVLQHLSLKMVGNWRQLADLGTASAPREQADPWTANNRGRILRSLPATETTLRLLADQASISLAAPILKPELV